MKEDMYLRIKQVTARTGLSRATIYGMMGIGRFPMKTALGVRAVGWLSSEIEQWMLERKTAEKEGTEASPGRKRDGLKKVATQQRSIVKSPATTTTSQAQERAAIIHSDEFAGWEDTSPLPSSEDMDEIRSKLALNNRKKPVPSTPVQRTSKSMPIHAKQPKLRSSSAGEVALKLVKRK